MKLKRYIQGILIYISLIFMSILLFKYDLGTVLNIIYKNFYIFSILLISYIMWLNTSKISFNWSEVLHRCNNHDEFLAIFLKENIIHALCYGASISIINFSIIAMLDGSFKLLVLFESILNTTFVLFIFGSIAMMLIGYYGLKSVALGSFFTLVCGMQLLTRFTNFLWSPFYYFINTFELSIFSFHFMILISGYLLLTFAIIEYKVKRYMI